MYNYQKFYCILFLVCSYVSVQSQQLAFPGAEGFGKYTTGGRGGTVYHVTNLNDAGPGSFRDAVSKPNRIVVFDVAGVIHISDRIVVNKNITIAGQTAPGGGITIYGNGVAFNGDSGNNIVRYIRIRMGKNGDATKDAISISDDQNNYIFDHVSVSWGRDGTFDANTKSENITLQDCIIGQGINVDNHSTGGLIQCGPISFIRTLWIDNKTRNPKIRFQHEFINSVVYNWATNGYIMGDTEATSECNMMGCYFIYGPSSSGSHFNRPTPTFNIYGEDNWVDKNKDGNIDGTLIDDYGTATVAITPFDFPGVDNLMSAQDALAYVINNVGASKERDMVDKLLIDQLLSYGKKGQIITTEEDNKISGNVGKIKGGLAPLDTDRDGMPDEWEFFYGLNPKDNSDQNEDLNSNGYTNIEEFLNGMNPGEGSGLPSNDTFLIESSHSEKVLTGEAVIQKTYSGSSSDVWEFLNVSDSIYMIKNYDTGKYLAVQDSSMDNGTIIISVDSTGHNSQLWQLIFLGEGLYNIKNVNSRKSLSVKDGSVDDGIEIIQEDFTDEPYQKFRIYYNTVQIAKPLVILESPLPGNITIGTDVLLEATSEDYDGEIVYVNFMVDDKFLYRDTIPPYRFIWRANSAGEHVIKAVSEDNDGNKGTSSEVIQTVFGSQTDYLIIQENENGYCSQDGTVDSNNEGFTGAGFANSDNEVGKGVNWKVTASKSGSVSASIRYACESDNRQGKLLVNDQVVVVTMDFPKTGSWTSWKTVSTNVTLAEGTNTLRLEALGSGGLANIDYLMFEDTWISAINCNDENISGKMSVEYFNNISGTQIEDVVFNEKFPINPDTSFYLNQLEAPLNVGDNFGARIRGFIHPANDGKYYFWLSGDESCQLWLSTDDTPANAQKLIELNEATDIREWDKFENQKSEAVELLTGEKYYIEIVQKEGNNDDNLAVAWSGPGLDRELIDGAYISHWTNDDPTGVDYTTDISNVKTDTEVDIYPNPTNNLLNISFKTNQGNKSTVHIVDMAGKSIIDYYMSTNPATIDLNDLKAGLYFVRIATEKNIYTRSVIKK